MSQVLFAVLWTVAAQTPQPATPPHVSNTGRLGAGTASATMLEGQWTLLYGEREGHQLDQTSKTNVSIHGNVLTFNMDGQQHNWRLNFGPRQMLQAWHMGEGTGSSSATSGTGATGSTAGTSGTTGTAAGHAGAQSALRGVYILSGDFLCLSLEPSMGAVGARRGAGTGIRPATTGTTGTSSGQIGATRGTDTGTNAGQVGGSSATGTGSAGGMMAGPHQNQFFVLILQRHGGTTHQGAGR